MRHRTNIAIAALALGLAACATHKVVPFDEVSGSLHADHPRGSSAQALVADLEAQGYVPARAFPDSPPNCYKHRSDATLFGGVYRTICYEADSQGRIVIVNLYQITAGL
jgi:hypothetical protein